MADGDVDLFVIGAGSGGVRAARIAAQHGARVMIAEEYRVGGTCVIRGCVPKKLLVHASRFAHLFEDAVGFGWTTMGVKFDWPKLIENKDREIARLEAAYHATLKRFGVEIIESRAIIEDANTVRILKTGARIRAGTILIATGGYPTRSDVPGDEFTITSNEALQLSHLPRHIIIRGGGYIAVEFACLFHAMGAQVTLLHRGSEILRGFDDDVRHHLRSEMVARGIKIVFGQTVTSIRKIDGGLEATLTNGEKHCGDQILSAIGRVPNTKNLGLETAGVKLGKDGAVAVDEFSKTNIPSIYAVGDVTNRIPLTPVAIREGHAFADTVFGKTPRSFDHISVPSAVFSEPELATVGLSETKAREAGYELDIYRTGFRPLTATMSSRATSVLMKLVVDRKTDRVLGVHIVGDSAAEMIQMATIAVRMGAKKSDFDAAVALHPTSSEELVTLHNKVSD